MSKKYTSIHYHSYLQLDKLLSAQKERSGEFEEKPAHDETLFIIMHQVYELWFKQMIHELESVNDLLRTDELSEEHLNTGILRLKRISEILELMIKQIFVMETLTPLDFMDFRHYLFPASGFQSLQFRVFENILGLRDEDRMTYNGHSYKVVFSDEQKERLETVEQAGSLFELVEKWLERIPFLKTGDYNFLDSYKGAVDSMLSREKKAIEETDYLSDKMKAMRMTMLGSSDTYFKQVLSEEAHEEMRKEGKIRLSYKATLAALQIKLYREKPIFFSPNNLLTEIINIDELLTTWRYRHAQMVMRMIGNKVGTGGSSGHDYLAQTAEKHKVFKDFHNISSLLISRSDLPVLPKEVEEKLGYHFTNS